MTWRIVQVASALWLLVRAARLGVDRVGEALLRRDERDWR